MQEFELEIDHSITYYRKAGILSGDRIRDKTYHSFGGNKKFFAAKRDESLFDFWLFDGRFFAIEAKQTAEKSLPYKNIKSHQIENLTQVDRLGGIGIFLVNFRSTGKRGKDAWNVTFALDIKDFLRHYDRADRSSIEFEYFEKYGYKIDRVRVGFSKPKKEDVKPKPVIGWDLVSLQNWNI